MSGSLLIASRKHGPDTCQVWDRVNLNNPKQHTSTVATSIERKRFSRQKQQQKGSVAGQLGAFICNGVLQGNPEGGERGCGAGRLGDEKRCEWCQLGNDYNLYPGRGGGIRLKTNWFFKPPEIQRTACGISCWWTSDFAERLRVDSTASPATLVVSWAESWGSSCCKCCNSHDVCQWNLLERITSLWSRQPLLGLVSGSTFYEVYWSSCLRSERLHGHYERNMSLSLARCLLVICLCNFVHVIDTIDQSIQ